MITQETKDEIEKEARKWSRTVMGVELSDVYEDPREVDAYIAGATKYAEKVENLEKEIERLKLEVKILRQESRDIDINYDLHEGKGENNKLL